MLKRVFIVASGETERRALPLLVRHLASRGIDVSIGIPPRNQKITVSTAEKLIKSRIYDGRPPDKVVILLDMDGKDPNQYLKPFMEEIPKRIRDAPHVSVQYAFAQWHLEAWFFGDELHLRQYLGGQALGNVDTSLPDKIENPKQHLRNLLVNRIYTALVSAEIASSLCPQTIAGRSPSFSGFLEAILNGETSGRASPPLRVIKEG